MAGSTTLGDQVGWLAYRKKLEGYGNKAKTKNDSDHGGNFKRG